jgi:non-heme chloroperoxidase
MTAAATADPVRSAMVIQIVPYVAAGPLSAKLLKNGTLKTYKDFPHGMPTTQADTINADLLAFLRT